MHIVLVTQWIKEHRKNNFNLSLYPISAWRFNAQIISFLGDIAQLVESSFSAISPSACHLNLALKFHYNEHNRRCLLLMATASL